MPGPLDPPTIVLVLAVVGVVVLVVLLQRYRRLERRGTPLPPGAGGARLVGVEATMATRHDPPGSPGSLQVLGDDWLVADDVTGPLPAGQRVRVTDVVGTRLMVVAVTADPDANDAPDPLAGRDRPTTTTD